MREIKFRAWDAAEGQMFEVSQLNFSHDIDGFIIDDLPRQKQLRLMQYTGLKDRNGVEIYEGDVAKLHCSNNTETNISAEVLYGNHSYDMRLLQGWDVHKYCGMHDCFRYAEVIGNIYENPELLK